MCLVDFLNSANGSCFCVYVGLCSTLAMEVGLEECKKQAVDWWRFHIWHRHKTVLCQYVLLMSDVLSLSLFESLSRRHTTHTHAHESCISCNPFPSRLSCSSLSLPVWNLRAVSLIPHFYFLSSYHVEYGLCGWLGVKLVKNQLSISPLLFFYLDLFLFPSYPFLLLAHSPDLFSLKSPFGVFEQCFVWLSVCNPLSVWRLDKGDISLRLDMFQCLVLYTAMASS